MADDSLTGLDKSAILMLALDEDTAASVFKHLSTHEAQQLGLRMASIEHMTAARVNDVFEDFNDELDQFAAMTLQSKEHIRAMLIKALGEERAASLLEDIFDANSGSGIDALNMMESATVAEIIRDEHPQIIATIIVHLERNQAADVLLSFDEALRNDIVLRVATFSGVQPAALAELTEVLSQSLSGQYVKRSKMGGVTAAADLLNRLNRGPEESALNRVREHDSALADRIVEEMFVFRDLERLDDAAIRRLLADIDTNVLAVALKGASDGLLARFTDNMASRAGDMLREDMAMRGPIRMSQVETERNRIPDIARELMARGEITIDNDEDEYV